MTRWVAEAFVRGGYSTYFEGQDNYRSANIKFIPGEETIGNTSSFLILIRYQQPGRVKSVKVDFRTADPHRPIQRNACTRGLLVIGRGKVSKGTSSSRRK